MDPVFDSHGCAVLESWRLETVTDMIEHAKVVCNQSNRRDGFNIFVGKHQWSKKDLKEAPYCNMLQTGILMNYPRSTTSSNQSSRIIHCDNTQPGSPKIDADLPPATCLRQKASIVPNLLSSTAHENRVRRISAIVLLSTKMPKKNLIHT